VLRRLASEDGGEPINNVAQTFGGGKSHTPTALYYMTTLGAKLPKQATSVQHILAEAKLKEPPNAVVAAVSFDMVDWKTGGDAKGPDGTVRSFRMPWNLIAWQLLGQQGLDILGRDETEADYDTPPADTLWSKLLAEVEKSGKGALILVDEFLMWAHGAASPDPTGSSKDHGTFWNDRLKNFFQRLAQAVVPGGVSPGDGAGQERRRGQWDSGRVQSRLESAGVGAVARREERPGGIASSPDVREVSGESGGPASTCDGVLGPDEGD
jgi:hypothetical protein